VGARARAPRFELADIVREHRSALQARTRLTREQRRVLTDVAQCRTSALGGHLDNCDRCGFEHPSYNSCRNRHCPKCQALAQENWIAQQRDRMVDVPHFHVVFTLPASLRQLAAFAPALIYGLLFQCAGATLLAFGRSRLHARIGATLVLHTWTKDLRYHPHVHAIVTAGGVGPKGTWVPAAQRFLFPVKAMSRVLRGKMRAALRHAHADGAFRRFSDFDDPEAFRHLLNRLGRDDWYVYAKPSFSRAKHVVQYLGRYTHRVALSNGRILSVSDDSVTIRTRGEGRAAMPPLELLRRFVQHVLPIGFHKIRHYGLYACRPTTRSPTPIAPLSYQERLKQLTGRDVTRCPRCGGTLRPGPLPTARAPPEAVA
jgi:hypothetical protein